MRKYDRGIQTEIFEIIKKAKVDGNEFLTRKDIKIELKKKKISYTDNQIGQALYQLQKKGVYKRPKIKIIENGQMCGYTVVDDLYLWKNNYNLY